MPSLLPLVFAERGTGRLALRALYPLISEDAPVTEIHVAMEGSWEGHPSGPFSLTRDDFDQIVRNFEASPNPIPLDYEHATEWAEKAPACGWVQGLEVRDDDDGTAHLWATVELSDEAAGYVRTGAYRFSSGVFVFESVDHVTGDEIGTELTSLALTNMPFVRGQQPIQLSRRAARRAAQDTRVCMTKLTKEALLAALDQFEGDEIDMEQLEAAAHLAAVKDGGAEEEAPEAPASDEVQDDVPASTEPEEATEASDEPAETVPAGEPAGDEVALQEDGAEGDQATAALAPLMEATGMDLAMLSAAIMEKRDELAAVLQGGGDSDDAGGEAPLSDREINLSLSARDNTIRALSTEVETLRAFKEEREREDAKAWACSLRDSGKITDADVGEWTELRYDSPDKAERLAKSLSQAVPLKSHATGHEPPTPTSDGPIDDDADVPEDKRDVVKQYRKSLSVLGGKWADKSVQDREIRKRFLTTKSDRASA